MSIRENILKNAKSLMNYTNYKMGAKYYNCNNNVKKPKLLDCSGFVVWCYKMVGISVPDGTYHQWNNSHEVAYKDLQIGDIGIKENGGLGMYNHIGIYAGDGKWIHCNYGRNGVTLEKTSVFKYFRRFNVMKGIDFVPTNTTENKTTATTKGDDELITKAKFKVNGKIIEMERILKNGNNYIKIQDFEKAGFEISYDASTKTAQINTK